MAPLLREDLDHVLDGVGPLWEELRGRRIFVTGGTGFFGCWLLETLLEANARLGLGAVVVALSRDPAAFMRRVPHLGNAPSVRWVRGAILELTPELVARQLGGAEGQAGTFDAMIHLVTEANVQATAERPLASIEVIVEGTRRALEFARETGAKRFLFTSSGAVYGRQPLERSHFLEGFAGAPATTDVASAYGAAGNAKRHAELLCAAYAKEHGLGAVIARCFTFTGPHLPLDGKFAIGNFLSDVLAGRDIVIKGDGTPVRSYLYAADLAIWLWTLLLRGVSGRSYHVGSEHAATLREVAETVSRVDGRGRVVRVLQSPDPARPLDRYVPETRRGREEFGLQQGIALEEAVRRTLIWCRKAGGP
jgi:nucleoside-diphosphate-sugar epimerase